MSYTNAQVATLVKGLAAEISSLRADVARLSAPAAVAAPAAPSASAPEVTIPERGRKSPRFACSKHADHKAGKGFTANGRAAHASWCDGTWSEIA